jgi:hypothetical protein
MSPPSKRIESWINHMEFRDAEEVREYVRQRGGASLAMDATIDFVFGTGIQESELPVPQTTGLTPLEQLQRGEGLPEQPEIITPFEQEQPLPQEVQEAVTQPVEQAVKKSLFRRIIEFFGG